MHSLDTLTLTVSPIDAATLAQVDGGFPPLIIAFAIGFALGFGGSAALDW